MRLGEILQADYRVPAEAVQRAIHFQRTSGTTLRLGEILVKLKVLPRRELMAALGQQLGAPVVVGLARMPIPSSLCTLVSKSFAETRRVVPVGVSGPEGARRLLLAMADPTDALTIDVVERAAGCEVVPVIALEEEIQEAIALFYGEGSVRRRADRLTPTPPTVPVASPRRVVSPAATRPSAPLGEDPPTPLMDSLPPPRARAKPMFREPRGTPSTRRPRRSRPTPVA